MNSNSRDLEPSGRRRTGTVVLRCDQVPSRHDSAWPFFRWRCSTHPLRPVKFQKVPESNCLYELGMIEMKMRYLQADKKAGSISPRLSYTVPIKRQALTLTLEPTKWPLVLTVGLAVALAVADPTLSSRSPSFSLSPALSTAALTGGRA